jgi:hypothetical protein
MSETDTLNRRRWRTVVRVLAPVLGGLLAASAVAAPAPAAVPDNTVLELFAGASAPLTPTTAATTACGDKLDDRTFPPGLPPGSFAQIVIQGTVLATIPAIKGGSTSSQSQVNDVVCWNIGGKWVLASQGYRPPRVSADIPLVVGTTVVRAVTTRKAVNGKDSLTAERVVHRGNRARAAKDDVSFILSGVLGALTADTATVGGVDFAVDANSEIDPVAAGDVVSVQFLPTALLDAS